MLLNTEIKKNNLVKVVDSTIDNFNKIGKIVDIESKNGFRGYMYKNIWVEFEDKSRHVYFTWQLHLNEPEMQ